PSKGTARPARIPVFNAPTCPSPANRTGATIHATRPARPLNGDRASAGGEKLSQRKARTLPIQSPRRVGKVRRGRSRRDGPLGTSMQEKHPNQLQRSDQRGRQPHGQTRGRSTERSRGRREQCHLGDAKRRRPRRFVCI